VLGTVVSLAAHGPFGSTGSSGSTRTFTCCQACSYSTK